MSTALENEQKKLKDDIPIMEQQFNSEKDKSEGLQHFINKAKKLTHLTELTPEILHEFIEKIVVNSESEIMVCFWFGDIFEEEMAELSDLERGILDAV